MTASDDRYNRSDKGRERWRRYNAKRSDRPDNPKRVYVGELYVGMAPTPEQASILNDEARREFHGR